jgi:hypothetical protein
MGLQDRDWYWDAKEAAEREQFRPRPAQGDVFWKIVAAVFIGSLLASIVFWGFQEWRARQQAEMALEVLKRTAAAAEAESRKEQAAAAARQARLRAEQSARQAAAAQEQRRANAARQAAIDYETAKAAAWSKAYKRPARCETQVDVECANDYIKAKRAFEAEWARAHPRP